MTKKEKISYFEKRVNYYFFDFFKLQHFELHIFRKDDDDSRGSSGWHAWDVGAGQVSIFYNKEWIADKETLNNEIDKVAFHEVCECLLSELNELIRTRFIEENIIAHAIHRVIRTLEGTVYPLIKKGK